MARAILSLLSVLRCNDLMIYGKGVDELSSCHDKFVQQE